MKSSWLFAADRDKTLTRRTSAGDRNIGVEICTIMQEEAERRVKESA
jgi:hypothetical protein